MSNGWVLLRSVQNWTRFCRFIRNHEPPQYEARVLIGYDAESETVIAHWLDSFGAKYSVPRGTGTVSGNTIQFTVPYENGPFLDTFV